MENPYSGEEMINRNNTKDSEVSINTITNEKKNSVIFTQDEDSLKDILKCSIFDGVAYLFLMICFCFTNGDAFKFIFGVWCLFMIFGNVSGAHVNPIITFGLWLYDGNIFSKPNLLKLIFYGIFQMLGAFIGCLISYNIILKNLPWVEYQYEDVHWIRSFTVEMVFGGTIVFVGLFISSHSTRPSTKSYVNLTVLSLWILLCIWAGTNVSGGCYNPTFFIILNGFTYYRTGDWYYYEDWVFYTIAPFCGSIIFTLIFKYIFRPYYISKNNKIIGDD